MKVKIPIADMPQGTNRHLVRFRVMDESGNSSYWVYFSMTKTDTGWIIDKNEQQPQGMV